MAEVLASLKKIGGNGEQYTETVLWTNPSPTASFATQTVTLSDSITNYKYLLIRYKDGNSGSDTFDDICVVSDFIESVYDKSAVHSQFGISMQNSGNRLRTRAVGYVSATSIKFSACYNCNTSGSDDTCAIPLEILGINELAHGTIYEHYATGYFTNTVRSVDLGFVPKYVFCANGGSTSGSNNSNIIIYDANVSTTQFKFMGNGTEEMRNIGTIGSAVQFCMEGTVIGMNPNATITNFMNSHRQYVAIGYDNQ